MSKNKQRKKKEVFSDPTKGLPKVATGIEGLDEITAGGLPKGRPTLVCGGAGCGKTLLAMAFLAHGAENCGEPGVMMSFEESDQDIALNLRSLGLDVKKLIRAKKLAVDQVRLHRHEIDETGSYDLEALFVRLNYAIDSIGARRVVLDSIETIFGGLTDQGLVRAELRRLFEWLKKKGVTAVVTGERGEDGSLTRHGLEEYISDCVIVLDHRVVEQVSTRRLRVVKYRGSPHGANEYPFLIDETGLSVLPVTSLRLEHAAPKERVSTGIAGLDELLGGKGYYKGSTILISGSAGSGKTSVCAQFAHAACARGERTVVMAFEESQSQYLRNMGSIGLHFKPFLDRGLLQFHATRSTSLGLELHLATAHRLVEKFNPQVVVLDPTGRVGEAGSHHDAGLMFTRLLDYLKGKGVTVVLASLTPAGINPESAESAVSSMVDSWVALKADEDNGRRQRTLTVLKSRGMWHSDESVRLAFTPKGLQVGEASNGRGR